MAQNITVSGIQVPVGLYINGKWVQGSGESLETINPATEESLGHIQTASNEDVDKAVAAARECLETTWGLEMPGTDRGALMFKLADAVDKNTEDLALLESLGEQACHDSSFRYVDDMTEHHDLLVHVSIILLSFM